MSRNDDNSEGWFSGISWRLILLHPALWFLLATILMIGGAINFWGRYRDELISSRQFDLSSEKIEINQPPAWVQEDLRQTVISQIKTPGNLLDANLVSSTARTLAENPWIENVNRVEKVASGLRVNLSYRYPIAIVEFLQENIPPVPVDRMAVVMDREVLRNFPENRLLRITVPRPDTTRPKQWDAWQDVRVVAAARLCNFLGESATDLELFRVVTFQLPTRSGELTQPLEIWTSNGTKVIWGSMVTDSTGGEASPQQKLEALQQFVVENGPLVNFDRRKKIDVRTGRAILVDDLRTAGTVLDALQQLK